MDASGPKEMSLEKAIEILELKRFPVSEDELRTIYKNLVKHYHPDTHPDDIENCLIKTKQINVARDRLKKAIELGETVKSPNNHPTGFGQDGSDNGPVVNPTIFPPGTICPKCHGSGKMKKRKHMPFGDVDITVKCNLCGGMGKF